MMIILMTRRMDSWFHYEIILGSDQCRRMNQLKYVLVPELIAVPELIDILRRYRINFRAFVCCRIMFIVVGWLT